MPKRKQPLEGPLDQTLGPNATAGRRADRAIKKAFAHGHPVACGLRWPKDLKGYELIQVPPPNAVFDGHSIALVGYVDDAQDNGGVFLFRNSWGPKWGKNGYGSMSYAYTRAYANDVVWLELGPPILKSSNT